jgi:hypothetical protein
MMIFTSVCLFYLSLRIVATLPFLDLPLPHPLPFAWESVATAGWLAAEGKEATE